MLMRCLVLESVPLVAEDLALLIEESAPGTKVILTGTMSEAEAALDAEGGCDVAFVNADPERFAGTSLDAKLRQAGAVIVFLGHEVEAARAAQRYLERPFSGVGVMRILELLKRNGRRRDPTS